MHQALVFKHNRQWHNQVGTVNKLLQSFQREFMQCAPIPIDTPAQTMAARRKNVSLQNANWIPQCVERAINCVLSRRRAKKKEWLQPAARSSEAAVAPSCWCGANTSEPSGCIFVGRTELNIYALGFYISRETRENSRRIVFSQSNGNKPKCIKGNGNKYT